MEESPVTDSKADIDARSKALKRANPMRLEIHDPRFVAEEIIGPGENLYDPQVFWNWQPESNWGGEPDSILVSDIGGQKQPGWDPTMGHGALYRLHADNRLETIMAPGHGRQAGVFRPTIAPQGWGDWGGHIFFCSQIVPGRKGAVMDHMVYRLAPGETTPHPFAIPPRAGVQGGGMSGALLTGVFGRKGTPEAGLLLIHSNFNCTIYAVDPDGSVDPWIIMDGVNGPGPLMPYRLYYAPESIVGERDMLVVEGPWGRKRSDHPSYEPGYFRIKGQTLEPTSIEVLKGGSWPFAPEGFGPFAGQIFRPDHGGYLASLYWEEAER